MADQIMTSNLAEIYRAIRKKERELSQLDLMLADYHTERSRLIRELRWLQAQLQEAKEIAASTPPSSK